MIIGSDGFVNIIHIAIEHQGKQHNKDPNIGFPVNQGLSRGKSYSS